MKRMAPRLRRRRSILARLWRDRRGVAAVEMALVSTFILIPATVLVIESGQALLTQYRLSRGLHAGLMFAWGLPLNATLSQIQNAANSGFQANSSPGYAATTVTSVATFSYYCIDPTVGIHYGAKQAANTTCTGGQVLASYVSLSLTATLPLIFPIYQGSTNWSLNVAGTARTS